MGMPPSPQEAGQLAVAVLEARKALRRIQQEASNPHQVADIVREALEAIGAPTCGVDDARLDEIVETYWKQRQ